MDELTLVPKNPGTENNGAGGRGRPARETFALRCYAGGETVILTLLRDLVKDGDRIDFYLSERGFAVLISPEGERAISKSAKNRTASVPLAIRSRLTLPTGTTSVGVVEDRGGGLYFFPFDQFHRA
jgi:hypothetical protein